MTGVGEGEGEVVHADGESDVACKDLQERVPEQCVVISREVADACYVAMKPIQPAAILPPSVTMGLLATVFFVAGCLYATVKK